MTKISLLASALLLFPALYAGAQEWHESDFSGRVGPRISEGPAETGWNLSINRSPDLETHTLYSEGEVHTSTQFLRSGGRLISREERNGAGKLLARAEYSYDPSGRPRVSYIEIGEGDAGSVFVESHSSKNADAEVGRHVSGSGDTWILTDSAGNGRPVRKVSLADGELVRESLWQRSEDGLPVESRVREGEETTVRYHDPEGRVLREEVNRSELVVLTRLFTWSGDNLVRVEERGGGRRSVKEVEWTGDKIRKEIRIIDGTKYSETLWTNGDDRVETFFRGGKAIVRVYWSKDRREKDEFLEDGEVIRTRDYEGAE